MNADPSRSRRPVVLTVLLPAALIVLGLGLILIDRLSLPRLTRPPVQPTATQAPESPKAMENIAQVAADTPVPPGAAPTLQKLAAGVTTSPEAATTTKPTLIVVTPRPKPVDVFAAATLAAQTTSDALQYGTPTATPPNMVTATYTPRPLVITRTPTPGNAATAEFQAALAAAAAASTGTPTPLPAWAVIASETPTLTPKPTSTERPTNTPRPTASDTPVMIALAGPPATRTPTPSPDFPPLLVGKVLFLSDMAADGRTHVFAVDPDGSGLSQLTADWPYARAMEGEAYSADKTYRAYVVEDITSGRLQINYYDTQFNTSRQMTSLGAGIAWAPAFAPAGDRVAFVSNVSGNDEIWVVKRGERPEVQLTHNTWEWDHHPSWSPDGRQIVFGSNRSGKQQLWIMNADGSDQQPLTPWAYDAWDPVWTKSGD